MVIQHNIAAINSHRNLGINNTATNKNLEKLSSGFRINRAGDDAAGLAISEKMRGQIRGLAMAEQNTSNGISLIQTAEGGLNETHAILQRMRELAVQASNGTYQDEDRLQIGLEVQALKDEIDRIATSTHYNGIRLLDGNLDANGFSMTATKTNFTDLEVKSIDFKAATTDGVGFAANSTYDLKLQLQTDGSYKLSGKVTIGGDDYDVQTNYTTGDTVTVTVLGTTGTGADATIEIAFNTGEFPTNGFEISGEVGTTLAIGATKKYEAGTDDADLNSMNYGTFNDGESLVFQIGANGTADQQVGMSISNMSTSYIGVTNAAGNIVFGETIADIDITTRENANAAIAIIDAATNMVSSQRAELGAMQNRLEHTLNNLGVTKENLTAAESTIRDVDMAKEMMEFTKNSILVQASQAMLAQANQLPQGVLSLLR